MKGEARTSITLSHVSELWEDTTRREFMRLAAIGGTAIFLPSIMAGCSDSNNNNDITAPPTDTVVIDLSKDAGVLNYAYALEQLEAAFYSRVVSGIATSQLSASEQVVLTDIRNHEVIHRDFLATALGTAKIPNLAVDFSSVNFNNRVSILRVAKTFEDIGVSAYNGAGSLLKDLNNLGVAGKIVSVEARHAATIRDLLNPGSRDFAGDDVVDRLSGLDQATPPALVLGGLLTYVTTPIQLIS
ncbi:MAG: ferritin-like domain-containing protein [Gemmatimonadaceae bacterium]